MTRKLLWAGVGVPVLYFGNLIGTSLTWPGYDHTRQYASELGSAAAPYPWLFNGAVMCLGVLAAVAGVAFASALRELTGHRVLPALFGVAVFAWGAGVFLAGMFPMPDERHGGFGLPLAIQVAPALLLAALWRDAHSRKLKLFVGVALAAMSVLFAVMMGVGELVTRANVGIWQRSYALSSIPWIGVAAYALQRRLQTHPGEASLRTGPAALSKAAHWSASLLPMDASSGDP